MTENDIAREIVDAALKIHRALGPGLLESVYRAVLSHDLTLRGLIVETERAIPVVYEGLVMETGFRADLIVEGKVIIEAKSVESIAPVQGCVYFGTTDHLPGG